MNNEIDPFDDIQCEDLYAGSPEPEPMTDEDLEAHWQNWKKENPEQAEILEQIEAFFSNPKM